jgi:hypothetical protein
MAGWQEGEIVIVGGPVREQPRDGARMRWHGDCSLDGHAGAAFKPFLDA